MRYFSIGSTHNLAFDRLEGFINYLDNLIKTNPNKNLDQIADLINY
ncbi:hypothetical protein UMM65_10755 [Aureibaculum sp. 2210JD6-5]|nr:hypothetical protein [Aureibaculum sp. 2210JD6-5]MDY7395724.1 hypothetical protein [Aureibaculum sp. 2210JD6-5]